MKKGKIGVTTENIFPIIKKFLYSDHEIFLRELISNAVDATQKLRTISSAGEFTGDLGDLTIRVTAREQASVDAAAQALILGNPYNAPLPAIHDFTLSVLNVNDPIVLGQVQNSATILESGPLVFPEK